MANFSFDNIRSESNSNTNRVGYFSLKNDGDTAVVRFMHDTVESFDVVNLHEVTINNQRRRVGCAWEPDKAPDYCPLCAAGLPFKQRMYVHMLVYEKDAAGNVTVTPRVWDRPVKYAYKLRDFINNYGPLSDILFIIKRNGAAGDQSTTYTEMPASERMYPAAEYPKADFPADYQALGNTVYEKSVEDMRVFLETGNFPMNQRNSAPVPQAPTYNQQPAAPQYQPYVQPQAPAFENSSRNFNSLSTAQPAFTPQPAPQAPSAHNPWDNGQAPSSPQRPVRFYSSSTN